MPSKVAQTEATLSSFATRVGAARLLNSLCAACGACARGARSMEDDEALTRPAPQLGPGP